MSENQQKKVLIVGGGFGGIKAALEISHNPSYKVTLLSDKLNFRYYPTLFHTATGGHSAQSSISLNSILSDRPIDLVIGEATKLDRIQKKLKTTDGESYSFDILILALGVVTNYFGIKGLEDFAYGIKSIEEANRLKTHLHQQITDDKRPDLNYIIIGGGPTGIELAGQLPQYIHHILTKHGLKDRAIHIDLVEAAPTLVPRLPKDVQKAIARRLRRLGVKLFLNQTVQAETADALMVNGRPIKSHTVIWTAGVTNHPFFKSNNFNLNERGKVTVDSFLAAEDDIYVLGDNADTPFSGMAQTALYDGLFLANNLNRTSEGKAAVAYKPKQPISIIPAGEHWAAVVAGRFHFYGRLGGILRETADLKGFKDLEPWWKAGAQWLNEFGGEESCPICMMRTNKT